jgi:ABC-type glycerol-3-phosphate transport system substrate-binding protein
MGVIMHKKLFFTLVFILTFPTLGSCTKKAESLPPGISIGEGISDISLTGNEDFPFSDRTPYDGEEIFFGMGASYPTNWPSHWPDYLPYQPLDDVPSGELSIMVGTAPSRAFHETMRQFFNEQYPGMTVNPIEYNSVEDITAALSAGNTPDIIDMGGQRFFGLTRYGFFTDLNTFINSDGTLKREDFYENILKALEVDGSLYYLVPYIKYDFVKIHFDYYARLPESVREKDILTTDEMTALYKDMFNETDGELPFIYSNQLSYASTYLTFNDDEYVNYPERYHRLGVDYTEKLDVLKHFEPDYNENNYRSRYTANIQSFFYVFPYDYTRLLDYLLDSRGLNNRMARFEFGADANIDGKDNHAGRWILDGTDKGDAFSAGGSVLSIPVDARNKELAWEYIKFALMRGPEYRKLSNEVWPPKFWGHSIHRPSFFTQMYNELTQLFILNYERKLPTSTYDAMVETADWLDKRNKIVTAYSDALWMDKAMANGLFADIKNGTLTTRDAARSLDAYFTEVFK